MSARPAVLSGLPPVAVVLLLLALALTAISGGYAGWLIGQTRHADQETLERRVADLERELAQRRFASEPGDVPSDESVR